MIRKKLLQYTLFSLLLIGAILGVFVIQAGGWENFKLQSTTAWGYVTLNNNPLLPGTDTDLKNLNQSNVRIEPSKLKAGGPPKDGIPSIDNPTFVSATQSQFEDEQLIVGVYYNGTAKAYPLNIMNWHEIVNDEIAGLPITVSYCPLCDTNSVFVRKLNGEEIEFGVSGKLFNSCLIMYDRKTDSLWSQVWGIGVGGEKVNEELKKIPAHRTTLGKWREKYPSTQVLSTDTGYNRDYSRYPYGSYYTDDKLIFNARNQEQNPHHPKEIVSYIWKPNEETPLNEFSGNSAYVVHSELKKEKEREIEFNGEIITVKWNEELSTVEFLDEKGRVIPSTSAFSFVYFAHMK